MHATLMKHEGEYFHDSDFEEEVEVKGSKKDKKVTYKDVIRKQTLKKIEDGESGSETSDSQESIETKRRKSKKGNKLFEKSNKNETFAEE